MCAPPVISIIIPTHNRKDVLLETLQALDGQTLATSQFEVVIADDGSTDGTLETISRRMFSYSIYIYRQESRGAAAARNLGVRNARGEILFFLDADMIPDPELLAQHLQSHQEGEKIIVVGRREENVDEEYVSPGFVTTSCDQRFAGGSFTYQEAFTCNFSICSDQYRLLKGFDEQFPASGYEDVEFAYRAVLAGFRIVPNYDAVAYHHHPMTLDQRFRQARSYQRSAALLFKKHPELRGQIAHLCDKQPIDWRDDPVVLILRKMARRTLAWKPVLGAMEKSFDGVRCFIHLPLLAQFLYWKIIGSYQLIGFREGIKEYGW
jgi:glycosyltransferase involved in cell wall biosynthesis